MQWISLIILIIYSIAEFFLLPKFIAYKTKIALKSTISSLVLLWLIFIISCIFKYYIPYAAYILVIISLIANSYFGYYLNLYNKTKKYDHLQHSFGSFSFSIFLYFLISNIIEYGGSKTFLAFYVLLLGVFYGTIYEIIEFINDLKHQEKMQKGLKDTNTDMVCNILGAFVASVAAYFIFL